MQMDVSFFFLSFFVTSTKKRLWVWLYFSRVSLLETWICSIRANCSEENKNISILMCVFYFPRIIARNILVVTLIKNFHYSAVQFKILLKDIATHKCGSLWRYKSSWEAFTYTWPSLVNFNKECNWEKVLATLQMQGWSETSLRKGTLLGATHSIGLQLPGSQIPMRVSQPPHPKLAT